MFDKPIIDVLKEKLGDKIKDISQPRERRIYLFVDGKDIQDAARIIFFDMKSRLCTATAIDTRLGVEIIYHFFIDEDGMMINLKTVAPRPDLIIKSVAAVFVAAEWIEREMAELFGVTFEGHPDPRRLLLADDFPKCIYPYRNDYPQSRIEGFDAFPIESPDKDNTNDL